MSTHTTRKLHSAHTKQRTRNAINDQSSSDWLTSVRSFCQRFAPERYCSKAWWVLMSNLKNGMVRWSYWTCTRLYMLIEWWQWHRNNSSNRLILSTSPCECVWLAENCHSICCFEMLLSTKLSTALSMHSVGCVSNICCE